MNGDGCDRCGGVILDEDYFYEVGSSMDILCGDCQDKDDDYYICLESEDE